MSTAQLSPLDQDIDTLIDALFYRNDLEGAAKLIASVKERYPQECEQDGRLLELQGCILFRQNQLEPACEFLRRAVETRPTDFGLLSNVGTIYNSMGKYEEAVGYYQRALAQRYEVPVISLNLGNSLMALGRKADALAAYKQAVAGDDNLILAHKNIADILFDMSLYHEAEAAWRRVIQHMPKVGNPYYSLAVTQLRLFKPPAEPERNLRRAIELGCEDPYVYTNLGISLLRQNKIEEALEVSHKALEFNPDSHQCWLNLAMIQMLLGDWERGLESYEHRLHITPDSGVTVQVPDVHDLWDGQQSLEGKTLLVRHEQGLGDTIQFARFLPRLRELGPSKIILETLGELVPVFRPAAIADEYVPAADSGDAPICDYQVMLGSLPYLLRIRPEVDGWAGPYLHPDPELVQQWADILPPHKKFRVGIVWQGSVRHVSDKTRSIALEEFRPLAEIRGVELIALQQGQGINQVSQVDFPVLPLRQNRNWMDTAAILPHLDLVISVDTSMVHIAGSMGFPCWVIASRPSDWRWGVDQVQSIWYPSVRIFRQHAYMEWGGVLRDVAAALAELTGHTE